MASHLLNSLLGTLVVGLCVAGLALVLLKFGLLDKRRPSQIIGLFLILGTLGDLAWRGDGTVALILPIILAGTVLLLSGKNPKPEGDVEVAARKRER